MEQENQTLASRGFPYAWKYLTLGFPKIHLSHLRETHRVFCGARAIFQDNRVLGIIWHEMK